VRIVKKLEIRKNEILDAAEKLFTAKGFERATVNDILDELGIAKGTFYHYFTSKEDALDAIVSRRIESGLEKARLIAASCDLGVHEKMLAVIMAQKPENQVQEEFTSVLHEQENALLHQKILVQCVLGLSPILQGIAEEGIENGSFSTLFPKESIEILLTSALVLFDDGYFKWEPEEMAVKIPAFLCAMERILGAKANSFADFVQAFST